MKWHYRFNLAHAHLQYAIQWFRVDATIPKFGGAIMDPPKRHVRVRVCAWCHLL